MGTAIRTFALATLVAAAAGCGDVIRQGRSPAVLVVSSLTALPGGGGSASTFLLSDVLVLRRTPAPCTPTSPCPTIFNDTGSATLSLSMKDTAVSPTSNNQVTVSRVTIKFQRADGHNVPGVDVPYAFDSAVTATIAPGSSTVVGFELVRHLAKEESPLVQLQTNPNIIATVAEITFYGQDLVGNAVTATGVMSVNFGNFADQ